MKILITEVLTYITYYDEFGKLQGLEGAAGLMFFLVNIFPEAVLRFIARWDLIMTKSIIFTMNINKYAVWMKKNPMADCLKFPLYSE